MTIEGPKICGTMWVLWVFIESIKRIALVHPTNFVVITVDYIHLVALESGELAELIVLTYTEETKRSPIPTRNL